jgi:gamma-glutamylcyclotransferase (GGCT)/AIG2-like uncharacterized protein YtfP
MLERLFVYGTLMRASSHPLAQELMHRATFEGEARFNGRLYLVSHYPAVVPSDMPEEWVRGEVFVVSDPDFLVTLDRYEECGPEDREPTEYRRLQQTVVTSSGESVEAWMYIYNRPVADLQRIASGQFSPATHFG